MQRVSHDYNQNPRLQVYQLQQEKKKLQEDFSQLLKEREQLEERCTSYEHEKIQLGPRLEESKWEVSSTNTPCTLNSASVKLFYALNKLYHDVSLIYFNSPYYATRSLA